MEEDDCRAEDCITEELDSIRVEEDCITEELDGIRVEEDCI